MLNLKLNPSCHNYKLYEEQGRCPLVKVCREDCVFVWKSLYDRWESGELEEDIAIEIRCMG